MPVTYLIVSPQGASVRAYCSNQRIRANNARRKQLSARQSPYQHHTCAGNVAVPWPYRSPGRRVMKHHGYQNVNINTTWIQHPAYQDIRHHEAIALSYSHPQASLKSGSASTLLAPHAPAQKLERRMHCLEEEEEKEEEEKSSRVVFVESRGYKRPARSNRGGERLDARFLVLSVLSIVPFSSPTTPGDFGIIIRRNGRAARSEGRGVGWGMLAGLPASSPPSRSSSPSPALPQPPISVSWLDPSGPSAPPTAFLSTSQSKTTGRFASSGRSKPHSTSSPRAPDPGSHKKRAATKTVVELEEEEEEEVGTDGLPSILRMLDYGSLSRGGGSWGVHFGLTYGGDGCSNTPYSPRTRNLTLHASSTITACAPCGVHKLDTGLDAEEEVVVLHFSFAFDRRLMLWHRLSTGGLRMAIMGASCSDFGLGVNVRAMEKQVDIENVKERSYPRYDDDCVPLSLQPPWEEESGWGWKLWDDHGREWGGRVWGGGIWGGRGVRRGVASLGFDFCFGV
ncbi:hypothetical protein DFP72DRAFT_1099510 [Ephemerocybe angulata]|uniref:Uncharacterized protein n=1 Tax=Ephemerocybe angulata TaxID=980116 RepID=A0A8H6LWA8_9AGAR|nr:hypothetical protein DFP72DRAFT_1099510 [Tulosesus angulatus]